MTLPASKIVTAVLLGAMIGALAGTMCVLPAAAAPLHTAGCHPARVPFSPRPAGYRCCVSCHPALLTNAVSPRPALQPLATQWIHVFVATNDSAALQTTVADYNGPPGVAILRI